LKSPKVGDSDVVPFTEEEVTSILEKCEVYKGPNKKKLVVLTKFMLATGLRISDAVMISKSNITEKGKEGWMVELRTMKTGTPVSCPLQPALVKSIMALDSENPFWSDKSDLEDATKNWRKIFTKIFENAGIEGHPHQFRHTFAKRLLVAGVPIGYVASLLGNTEQICRKHYGKWISERQAAVNKAVKSTWT